MSDGWSKVAAGLGREEPGDVDEEPAPGRSSPSGEAGRSVPAGWERVAPRQADIPATAPHDDEQDPERSLDGGPDGGGERQLPPRSAPSGWDRLRGAAEAGGRKPTGSLEDPTEDDRTPLGDLVEDAEDGSDDEADDAAEQAGPERSSPARRRPSAGVLGAAGAVVAVAVVVVVLWVLGVFAGGLPSGAAFSVNGKVTTVAQLQSQVKVLDELNGVTAPAQSDKVSYAAFLRSSAQALAVQQLVLDIARHEGISVPQKTTRNDLDEIVADKYNNDRAQFDQALSSAGLSEGDVLSALNAQAVQNALYAKHTDSKVQVPAAEVTRTFNASQPLTDPEQRGISIIVVATQATGDAVLAQLTGGANFATLASQDSLDSSKSNGGADGTYTEAQLQQSGQSALASAVFAAAPNAYFGPVQATGGEWVVGQVTSDTPGQTYTDDAATQAAIKNYLVDQQLRQQWIAYLGKQLEHAGIHYAATYRPAHPTQPPEPALPSVLQYVINAHTSTSGASTGSTPSGSGSTGTTPAGS